MMMMMIKWFAPLDDSHATQFRVIIIIIIIRSKNSQGSRVTPRRLHSKYVWLKFWLKVWHLKQLPNSYCLPNSSYMHTTF